MNAGLYVHIPFCEIKCGYCDFFVVAHKRPQIETYLKALASEMALCARLPEIRKLHFDTIFFGGGTPSLLSAQQVSALIELINAQFNLLVDPEITVETNPGTVDLEKLTAFKAMGVNRLSIGVQSFHPHELRFLDRTHSVTDIFACYDAARKAKFDNISLDLIFGLPGQTLDEWKTNLRQAVELNPEHISAYNLTYETGTPLTRRLQRGEILPCNEAVQRRMFLFTMDFLSENGYEHYELSNYARPGWRSLHNQKYWDGHPYLGLGVSAHSFLDRRRIWNHRSMRRYQAALEAGQRPVENYETIGLEQKALEAVFLGLRQRRGLNLQAFQEGFGVSFFAQYREALTQFFDTDLSDKARISALTAGTIRLRSTFLEIENGFLKLTREGILLSDEICAKFA